MRKNIDGLFATKDQLDSMNLIQVKIACANQALEVFPRGLESKDIGAYVQACIESLSSYKFLETDLWRELRQQYNLGEDVFLDLNSGQFYVDDIELNKIRVKTLKA